LEMRARPVPSAEVTQWWNALDALRCFTDVTIGLKLAHKCEHPDARWLSALCPPDDAWTPERVVEVMAGFVHAETAVAAFCSGEEALKWAQRAAAKGDRRGIGLLGFCFLKGHGVTEDVAKATELFREAAELGDSTGQYFYGDCAFGDRDWQRYH
jgi:TPR repeat protein